MYLRIITKQFMMLVLAGLLVSFNALANYQQSIEVLLSEIIRETKAPSLSVAVAHKGKLLAAAASGFADKGKGEKATSSTQYRTGSIAKVVGTTAFMKLVDSGKVSLQDPIKKYLAYLPKHYDEIKLIHLLTHTSGIRHYRFGEYGTNIHYPTLERATRVFRADDLEFAPGTSYLYSTYGINLIQGVIENVTGKTLKQYLSEELFNPVGMSLTTPEIKGQDLASYATGYRSFLTSLPVHDIDVSNKYIGGGMRSTPSDLVAMVAAIQAGDLMSDEARHLMFSVPFPKIAADRMIGWRKDNYKSQVTYAHGGAVNGFESFLVHFTEDDITVAVMVNQDDYDYTSSTLYKVFNLIKQSLNPKAIAS